MIGPLAVADLHDAQAVAGRDQPHGFGVDGDRAGGKDALGQILFMEMDGHDSPLWPKPPVRNRPLATGNERRPFRPKVRSDARSVGKEGVSTCRSRWSPYH